MALNDIMKFRICCYDQNNTQIALNTVYYLTTAETLAGVTPAEAALAMSTRVAPLYKALMSGSSKYRGVSAQLLPAVGGPPTIPVASVTLDGAGTGGGNSLPLQVSGIIGFTTQFAGRQFRGRIYPGLLSTGNQDAFGDLTVGGTSLLQALATSLLAVLTVVGVGGTASFQLQVRRVTGGPPPPPRVVSYTTVTAATARTRFATQRRRGQFGRVNSLPF